MKKLFLICLALAFLAGCAAKATPVIGPDGTQHYSIDCSSEFLSWSDCLAKASQVCGAQGYTNKFSNENATPGFWVIDRTMLIKCEQEQPRK